MDTDPNAVAAKRIFSFSKQPTRHPQSQQFLFPSISHRANAHVRTQPASRTSQQHQHIFPPTDFSTPQRARAKVEPISPAICHGPSAPVLETGLQEKPGEMHDARHSHYQYMPTPQTCERTAPRIPSEAPSTAPDAESDILDLSEIMQRTLSEAKANKSQLSEERAASANLRSQLSVLQATCDEQERRIMKMEADAQRSIEEFGSKDRETEKLRLLLDEKDEQIRVGQEKLLCAEDKIKSSDERVSKVKDAAKRGIENMSKNFDSLRNAVEHLKTRYEVSVETVATLRDELGTSRLTISDSLKGESKPCSPLVDAIGLSFVDLEPFMDPSGHHLVKANETRSLIQELQTDRQDAQQVIDFLKDKLHNLSTQLAEANEKVTGLENRRKEEMASLTRSAGLWETTSHQMEELATKLKQREKEDSEVLAGGLKLEIKLTEANKKIADLARQLDRKESEIEILRKEKQSLVDDLHENSKRLEFETQRVER
ncbi:hypothetical protein EV361DRAFT_34252 [Lentinula raphanica]|nr:hypothetical protein EV361DRAFT_34252 [Lentinula raphanica]